MKLDFRQRLLTTTLLVGASMAASPAFAQTTPPDTTAGTQPDATTAAQAPATAAPAPSGQDIVITGTRIPQPNLTSASPVTVLGAQDVKLAGTTRTEDLINSLPQAFATQGSNISNGSTGTASVNLRNLGSVRTLVLINGRRLQPGDPRAGSIADINFIPSSIVKRVDVLTGGASSVYGADAVAGVVNFIMDTNFTGLRIDAQASTFNHYNNTKNGDILAANIGADRCPTGATNCLLVPFNFQPPHGWSTNGGAQDISAAFGTNFDDNRGHIMAYATYRKQDALLQASRDYSFCSLAGLVVNDPRAARFPGDRPSVTRTGREFNCGGSNTSAFGTFFTSTGTYHVEGNSFVPQAIPFNFGPYNFYQRPDERYSFGTFAEYEISPGARPYLEAMFMNDTSNSQIAPSGDFFNTNTINCDNPLLSTQQFNTICNPANTFVDANGVTQAIAYVGRRNVEGGGRSDHLEHTAFRIVGGIKGDILKGVSYDAYYQFGTTRLSQVYQNDFSVQRLQMALDVIANPAVGGIATLPVGTPICRVRLTQPNNSVAQACVPYNVFRTGGVTQDQLDFLQIPLVQRGHANEQIADANVTLEGGEYGIQTPWSDRGVGLNVGVEYRKEAIITEPDASFQSGDGAGQGAPTLPLQCLHGVSVTQGGECGFSVREGFAELQVPIVSHSFIDEFTLTGGYRYSDYKVANHHFSTDTYKVEARVAPIPDILLRASYNRAVRAPNAVELFFTPFVGLGGTVDPCAGATPTFSAAQCAFTGVTAAQYGNINANIANQYNSEFSGNVNLTPETADTYTAGVLLKPRWVPGLSISADYFDIKVKNLVGIIPYQFILNNCATTGDAATCSLIHRQANNGSLWQSAAGFVRQHNTNIGALRTEGIDINGAYSHRLGGVGTLSVNLVGTWLRKLETDIGVPSTVANQNNKYDCAGFYGNTCGTPSPTWRHSLRAGFTLPNGLGISGRWRYFGKAKNDTTSHDCDLGRNVPATEPPNLTAHCGELITDNATRPADFVIPSQSYLDLTLTARIADKYQFRLGVNNILDKDPPILGGEVTNAPFGNGNTYPQVYDALGRFLFAGVTIDF